MHGKKHTAHFLKFILCVALLAELPFAFGLFRSAQEKIIDRFYLSKKQSNDVVIVAIDDKSIAEIGQWPWPRATFAQALTNLVSAQNENPRAVGIDVSFSEPSRVDTQDDDALAAILTYLNARSIPVTLPVDIDARGAIIGEPIPAFKAATHQGFINIPLDGDGVARHTTTVQPGMDMRSFSQVVAGIDAPDKFRIDYRGDKGFLTVSFADLAARRLPSTIFKDKIVLIGATAPNLHDDVNTPFNILPGITVNANAIETIVQKKYFADLSKALGFLYIALIVIFVALLVRSIKKIVPLFGILALIFAAIIIAASGAFSSYLVVPVFYFLIAFFGSLLASLVYHYIIESREKDFIRKSFQYYLTPHVIDEIVRHPEKLSLGGESKKMTILFSDIRGFTTISEALTPQELTTLLNEYLTAMTDIIMAHGGVVDKYIGDAIMAFWGAPLGNPNQATDAADATAEMIHKLAELNKSWTHPLDIGIGLNTGIVVVGNMGSHKRFNYTVMGDEVNLASRLESLTKYYRVKTIVSESTRTLCPDMKFRELDIVIVKGKKEPTRMYELVTDEPSPALQQALTYFERGRVAYASGDWDIAITEFEQAIICNNDGPSALFIERCKKFALHPPKGWHGVYEFDSK